MAQLIVIFLVIGAILVGIVSAGTLCFWALQPVKLPTQERRRRHQIRLSDVLTLFVMVQISLPLVFHLMSGRKLSVGVHVAMALLTMLITGYVWYRGAQYLSAIGIESLWRRTVYLVIVLPLALVATVTLCGWVFALNALFLGGSLQAGGLMVAAVVVLLSCAGLSRWLIAAVAPAATDDEIPEGGEREAVYGEVQREPPASETD